MSKGFNLTGKAAPKAKAAPANPLEAILNAAVRMKFGAQTGALKQQRHDMPSWFNNYRTALGTANAAITGTTQAMQSALQQQQAASAGIDQQYGANPDASAVNRGNVQALSGLVGQQGAAANNRINELSAISHGEQTRQKGLLAKAFTQLAGDKGAYRVSELQALQDAQQKSALEAAAFGLNVRQQNLTEQKFRNDTLISAGLNPITGKPMPKDKLDAWKLGDLDHDGIPNGQDPYPSTPGDHIPRAPRAPRAPSGGLTPSEKRTRSKDSHGVQDSLNNAIYWAKRVGVPKGQDPRLTIGAMLRQGEYGDPKVTTDKQGKQHVAGYPNGKPIPDYLVEAALDYVTNPDHHISDHNRAVLRGHGLFRQNARKYAPRPSKQSFNNSINASPGGDAAQ